LAGIGKSRMALRWVSAAEGQRFAEIVTELTETTRALGPFDAVRFDMQLSAVQNVITGQRVRWLVGIDRQVTERANVYNEKIDEQVYQTMVQQAAAEEYQKALIMETLKEGPKSVREMAGKTGLPVYTVSVRLNDLERRGQAELKGYEGSTPKFRSLAA
jgi:hypothetical protein